MGRRFTGILIAGTLLAAGPLAAQAPAEPPLPDGPGKATFERICSMCHTPTHVLTKAFTRAEWREMVDGMLYGPEEVTEKDRETIVGYLLYNFPKKVKINEAEVPALEAALEISPADAQAIIEYRKAHGPIHDVSELGNVPGWSAAKIEPLRKRIEF